MTQKQEATLAAELALMHEALADHIQHQGWGQFYFIQVAVTDKTSELFNRLIILLPDCSTGVDKIRFCEVELQRNDLITIVAEVPESATNRALIDGVLGLARVPKSKYANMYRYQTIF